VDLRASGVATAAVAVGDVFGGTSILACAAERLGALPAIRLGLSGPRVVETARGVDELDASDAAAVETLYGAVARIRAGLVDAVGVRAAEVRAWLASMLAPAPFESAVAHRQRTLSRGLAAAMRFDLPRGWNAEHVAGPLWRTERMWLVAPMADRAVDAVALSATDDALLAHVGARGDRAPARLLILEDSPGHQVSRAAEAQLLSRYFAHHACVLGVLRARGIRLIGALMGTGHSAAFFANALQADALCAASDARVIAMPPDAIARVTGVAAAGLIEDDPLLGHPVRHFAALGGVDAILSNASASRVLAFAERA